LKFTLFYKILNAILVRLFGLHNKMVALYFNFHNSELIIFIDLNGKLFCPVLLFINKFLLILLNVASTLQEPDTNML
jgi:hypothetical protein